MNTNVNSTLVSLRRVFHFDDKNDERAKKVAEGIMLNKKEEIILTKNKAAHDDQKKLVKVALQNLYWRLRHFDLCFC